MRRSTTALGTVLVIVTTALSGCGAGSGYGNHAGGAPAANQCLIDPVPGGTGIAAGGDKVTGSVSIDCGSTITKQSITLKLLHSASDASSLTEVSGGSAGFGGPDKPINSETLTVDAQCSPGWWKLDAAVSLTVTGQGSQSETVQTTAVRLSADNCKGGAPVATTSAETTAPRGQSGCTAIMNKPTVAHLIGGGVEFACLDTPKSWSSDLYLEYRSTSDVAVWETVEHDHGIDVEHKLFLYGSCRVGEWQVRYVVYGTDAQGGTISMTDAKQTYVTTCP